MTSSSPTRLLWAQPITHRKQKEKLAGAVAERLHDGDIVGVGSGSSSFLALQALAARATRNGQQFQAITTSLEMELACGALGVKTTSLLVAQPDWSFDGADEVDTKGNLIKGRGGAFYREKLVMMASKERYILIDASKRVAKLGQKFAVPIEVDPESLTTVQQTIKSFPKVLSMDIRQAVGKDGPIITEQGNLILDVRFQTITADLEQRLAAIPGVLESGLFIGYKPKVMVY